MTVTMGVIVPGLPHPILCPDANPGYRRLRDAYDRARDVIASHKPDLLLVYSTMWPSILGHQIQTLPHPEWVHVDELFHGLGSLPYRFRVDAEFGERWRDAGRVRGLDMRTVAHHGFPIDTGTVVALKLLNPDNALPVSIVSSNIYADRAETIVLAKAAKDTLEATGKRAVVVVVSTLSNRLHTDWIDPADDHIHSAKDEEWNQKLLEFLGQGRLEDVAQLSRVVQKQIRVKKVVSFKPMWFLSALMGANNRYVGDVLAYEPVHGTGSAVVTLTPTVASLGDKEFDEEDVERWTGNREVLDAPPRPEFADVDDDDNTDEVPELPKAAPVVEPVSHVMASRAPAPVGAYPHARRVGDLVYLSGVGPRQAGTNAIPGGPIRYDDGSPRDYDIAAQTRATIENVKAILEEAGSSLDKVIDVTAFLVDMDRDFAGYNQVYAEYFTEIGATRTTLAVSALPTPIAVELKVIARA